MNNYEEKIVNILLQKYYKRYATYKDAPIVRRIEVPISKLLPSYTNYDVDIHEKQKLDTAIAHLASLHFITYDRIPLSDDYTKVYLNAENIKDIENYASRELAITPRSFVTKDLKKLIKKYKHTSPLLDFYIADLSNTINNSSIPLDYIREQDLLSFLHFLSTNTQDIYVREASLLVYHDSKYFENNRKTQILSILYNYFCSISTQINEDENILERFHIYDTEQSIWLKGPIQLIFQDTKLDITHLHSGIALSTSDLNSLKQIVINTSVFMTIENKTSFLRTQGNGVYMYLGGFATKGQITFLNKVIHDNPNIDYYHFGDIDAGGFLIHQNLCEQTHTSFKLYHMDKEDLSNPLYSSCLHNLTELDVNKLHKLLQNPIYSDTIAYMLKHNVKLEQEIISLYLWQKISIQN